MADTQYIIDAIRNGSDGTYNPFTGETPTDGFMVGGVSWTMTADENAFQVFIEEYVHDFVTAHESVLQPTLTATAKYFVGWWTHNGRIYLDISEKVESHYIAWSLGVSRKEIAVWDVKNSREIPCTDS